MGVHGIRKSLEDVAYELKGIKCVLQTIWHTRYQQGETDAMDPAFFADEYISTEEASRRLNISDQSIRNWIAMGRKHADRGWKEGVHYINITPDPSRKAVVRIPWNQLIQSFAQNKRCDADDLRKPGRNMYRTQKDGL